jgi:hypothetical protein
MKALSWIYYAKRPLASTELVYALAIDLYEPVLFYKDVVSRKVVLDVCAGLATVDAENDTFRLVHYSLYEYLEATSENWFPEEGLNITR